MTTLKMPKVDRQILKNRENIIKDISNFTKKENVLAERKVQSVFNRKLFQSLPCFWPILVQSLNFCAFGHVFLHKSDSCIGQISKGVN